MQDLPQATMQFGENQMYTTLPRIQRGSFYVLNFVKSKEYSI